MPTVPGLPARIAALRLLDAVLRRGETLDQAFAFATRALPDNADRALARALAGEALRWLTDLDTLIDSATRQPLPADAKVRGVLRLMLSGWLRLETPPHAVIATGLPLLEGGPRRLAHGVFSTLSKQGAALPDVPTLPKSVVARWGPVARDIATGLVAPPPLDLAMKHAADAAGYAAKLGGRVLAPGLVRVPRGHAVEELAGYATGDWWAQDLAATLPVRLLGPGPGMRALDVCAAPGGKTMQLAAAGWDVTALDISKRRLERVSDNLARTQLTAKLVRADALSWRPKLESGLEAVYDAVLLDAPCTATGTARRHPDVLHRIAERQIAEATALQSALLSRAAGWVKPGGVLVYVVCSLEQAEGEAVASAFSATSGWPSLPVTPTEMPDVVPATALTNGWLCTNPGMLNEVGGLDGFFVARWRRPG